jgi:hypothetical protein
MVSIFKIKPLLCGALLLGSFVVLRCNKDKPEPVIQPTITSSVVSLKWNEIILETTNHLGSKEDPFVVIADEPAEKVLYVLSNGDTGESLLTLNADVYSFVCSEGNASRTFHIKWLSSNTNVIGLKNADNDINTNLGENSLRFVYYAEKFDAEQINYLLKYSSFYQQAKLIPQQEQNLYSFVVSSVANIEKMYEIKYINTAIAVVALHYQGVQMAYGNGQADNPFVVFSEDAFQEDAIVYELHSGRKEKVANLKQLSEKKYVFEVSANNQTEQYYVVFKSSNTKLLMLTYKGQNILGIEGIERITDEYFEVSELFYTLVNGGNVPVPAVVNQISSDLYMLHVVADSGDSEEYSIHFISSNTNLTSLYYGYSSILSSFSGGFYQIIQDKMDINVPVKYILQNDYTEQSVLLQAGSEKNIYSFTVSAASGKETRYFVKYVSTNVDISVKYKDASIAMTPFNTYKIESDDCELDFSKLVVLRSHDGSIVLQNDFIKVDNKQQWQLKVTAPSGKVATYTFDYAYRKIPGEVIEIKTIQDFQKIGKCYPLDGNYKLVSDLNFSGINNFEPILKFAGNFDGQNHTISNLHINQSNSENRFVGIFGYVYAPNNQTPSIANLKIINSSVTGKYDVGMLVGYSPERISIKNITLDNISIKINDNISDGYDAYYVGLLAGFLQQGATIENSYAKGTIDITARLSVKAGGLLGVGNAVKIYNSYADVKIKSNAKFNIIGGLAAGIYTKSEVLGSYALVDINSTDLIAGGKDGQYFVGGFVGRVDYLVKIQNCYAHAKIVSMLTSTSVSVNTITLNNSAVGGFVADMLNDCTITKSYASTSIDATGYKELSVGGFAGSVTASSAISSCYAKGYISASTDHSNFLHRYLEAGGFAGYVNASSVENSYATCNVSANVVASANNAPDIAGFIAYLTGSKTSSVKNCYATGEVKLTADSQNYFASGFALAYKDVLASQISNSFHRQNNVQVNNGNWSNGLQQTNVQAQAILEQEISSTTFAGWNTSIWSMQSSAFPLLLW